MQFEYQSRLFEIQGVSSDDHIYKKITRSGTFYEIDLLTYIYRLKSFIYSDKYTNVALDVGANIGNHSIFFGSFMADHLIAIEPNPKVLSQLRHNLSKNLSHYTLYETAVGEKQGKGAIAVPENMGNNIGAAKINLQHADGNIDITTLDAVFSAWKNQQTNAIAVPLIKIDVEGMEIAVLKGAKSILQAYKPHIFAEAATKEEFQKIYAYLHPLGYRKIPGRWAATPVYHFAYKPGVALLLTTGFMQIKKRLRKLKFSLVKRFR